MENLSFSLQSASFKRNLQPYRELELDLESKSPSKNPSVCLAHATWQDTDKRKSSPLWTNAWPGLWGMWRGAGNDFTCCSRLSSNPKGLAWSRRLWCTIDYAKCTVQYLDWSQRHRKACWPWLGDETSSYYLVVVEVGNAFCFNRTDEVSANKVWFLLRRFGYIFHALGSNNPLALSSTTW